MATLIKPDGTEEPLKLLEPNILKSLQEAVGGYIETLHSKDGRYLIVNEDGKAKRLPPNEKATKLWMWNGTDILVGNVVLCDKKEIDSEPDEDE
jgi:hypothetical protein